jgi:hypothetical protein
MLAFTAVPCAADRQSLNFGPYNFGTIVRRSGRMTATTSFMMPPCATGAAGAGLVTRSEE